MPTGSYLVPDLERTVALIVGRSPAMDGVATRLAELARSNAARHPGPTGRYASRIRVIKAAGGKDRLIVNDDPLAAPKELGHILVRGDRTIGYVRGLHAMRNAVTAMPAVT